MAKSTDIPVPAGASDELVAAQARILELESVRDAALEESGKLRDELAAQTAEAERFKAHSVLLDSIGWRLAVALELVAPDAEVLQIEDPAEILEHLDTVLAERAGFAQKVVDLDATNAGLEAALNAVTLPDAEPDKIYAPDPPSTIGEGWPIGVHIGAGVDNTQIDGVSYVVDPESGCITGTA